MGKKKQKPNAFSVFMHEFLDKERSRGRNYKREEWAAVAKPHYDKLTADEKERYKQKAKMQPARIVNIAPKFTSQGVPLEVVERELREAKEKKKYMEQKVKNIVENAFLDNDVKKRPFVFIMANSFYKNRSGLYAPAEVAVAKFNFQDAIYQFYHTFVDPGTVELGYAFEAKDNSEKYHRLPPPPNALGERNYEKVYTGILDVLGVRSGQIFGKDDEQRPYIFTRKQDTDMIESILDQLSNQQWTHILDVFELEFLFNLLKNKVDIDQLRITVTNAFIERDSYDATPNISCDFHENEDATRYCSLSYVRRWFYLFADHICEKIGVSLVPGKHLPSNAQLPGPAAQFQDNPFDEERKRDRDDDYSYASSTHTGYSKFEQDTDSSSSNDD